MLSRSTKVLALQVGLYYFFGAFYNFLYYIRWRIRNFVFHTYDFMVKTFIITLDSQKLQFCWYSSESGWSEFGPMDNQNGVSVTVDPTRGFDKYFTYIHTMGCVCHKMHPPKSGNRPKLQNREERGWGVSYDDTFLIYIQDWVFGRVRTALGLSIDIWRNVSDCIYRNKFFVPVSIAIVS